MKVNLQPLRNGETYKSVAQALGVSENTIGNIERYGNCTMPMLLKICQHYHVYAVMSEEGEITFHKSKEQKVIEL